MTAKKIKVTRWQCICDKCKEPWQSKTEERPKMCPHCKTKNYDRERTNRPSKGKETK